MNEPCRCIVVPVQRGGQGSLEPTWTVTSECTVHFPMLTPIRQQLILDLERREA